MWFLQRAGWRALFLAAKLPLARRKRRGGSRSGIVACSAHFSAVLLPREGWNAREKRDAALSSSGVRFCARIINAIPGQTKCEGRRPFIRGGTRRCSRTRLRCARRLSPTLCAQSCCCCNLPRHTDSKQEKKKAIKKCRKRRRKAGRNLGTQSTELAPRGRVMFAARPAVNAQTRCSPGTPS